MDINTPITYVPGVGPKKAATLLAEMGVRTVGDMLACYPYRYVDRTRFYTISDCGKVDENTYIQLRGRIVQYDEVGEGRSRRLVARFADGTGMMELVWFKGIRFIEEKLRVNVDYIVFGKPSLFNQRWTIAHPEVESYTEENVRKNSGFQAFYNTTERMKNGSLASAGIRKVIYSILSDSSLSVPETLPDWLVRQYGLTDRATAIRQIHKPRDLDMLRKAQARLKFEELFYIQLSIMRRSKLRQIKYKGYVFGKIGDCFNRFYNEFLPFPLTDAQKRVMREIRADMVTGKQMNRLLQGDVGSGKTMIALLSALIALDNGFQACIMAPTEILASQHYQSISGLLMPLGIEVQLLTGSIRSRRRRDILAGLADGSVRLLIGTHALIEDEVVFKNLGLVIIDEQHRFGVAQRARLWQKNIRPPHILVMTATPIPRTLAMTIYGDLDVSIIDQLPPGRKPVATYHYSDNKRAGLNAFLRKQIDAGRQVYVVYPLISENEKMDLKNLEEGYRNMVAAFPDCRVVMVHGQMKAADKEAAMQRFVCGSAQIMVATTVIEVGVNVPNASVMVIESAERFGLSQLHQLRGRVGRGAEQSYCILMSKMELADDTRRRLQIMCDSTDGFVIAEADLQLRGPGDIDGIQQSGLPFDMKIASLASDGQILQEARLIARDILERDNLLEHDENKILSAELARLQRGNISWGAIS
ncbi:MAG: ATP-dependent DNA helicase RecG [Candidatus Aphodosoma sp.]